MKDGYGKQITGVEPAFPAWEAGVLPMNHICMDSTYYNTNTRKCKTKIHYSLKN